MALWFAEYVWRAQHAAPMQKLSGFERHCSVGDIRGGMIPG
jgi:hypothetical protein